MKKKRKISVYKPETKVYPVPKTDSYSDLIAFWCVFLTYTKAKVDNIFSFPYLAKITTTAATTTKTISGWLGRALA